MANAGQKESCLAQSSLSKTIIKYRLAGESKQEQLATSKKVAVNEAIGGLTATIINVVYAAKMVELDLVPGMLYASCMR